MKRFCRMRYWNSFEMIFVRRIIRAAANVASYVIILLMHLHACRLLAQYGEESSTLLPQTQLTLVCVLLVLQLPRVRKFPLLILLPANLWIVSHILREAPMQDIAKLYFLLILVLMTYRYVVIPRGVFLSIHLITALFLTYALALAQPVPHLGPYYMVLDHPINVNTIGILGLACMMHWVSFFEMLRIKTEYRLLGQVLGIILGLYYVLHSDCRSALAAAAVFLVLYLVIRKPMTPRVYQLLSLLVLSAMAIFPFAYIRLAKRFGDLTILGSDIFSGRQQLWETALERIRESPLLGAGMSATSSMHHILVELALRFGVVAAITFFVLCVQKEKRHGAHRFSRTAQIAFLACMTVAFFESFFTDRYLNLFFLSFLLSAVRDKKTGDGS